MLRSNQYNTKLIEEPLSQPQRQSTHTYPNHHTTKWATFTYYGKEVKQISKLFKITQIEVAFRTQNTINILKHTIYKQINTTIVVSMKWNA
jgi:hypothetical protein